MKKTLGLLAFGMLFLSSLKAQQEMVLEGTYQGSNLFIQNPFASSGVGFCVIDVKVNGQTSIDEINSSAFEIDFSSYQLKKGQAIEIKISYKDDCTPRIVNPEVLRPTSSYVLSGVSVSKDGLIQFSTTGESGSLPFIIEQKRWNKWVKVGEVKGKGTDGANSYSFQTKPHSGKNIYRIKQIDYSRRPKYSKEFRLNNSNTEEVVVSNADVNELTSSLNFATISGQEVETMYEIFNMYGNIVKKGYGKKVDISGLEKGSYYVNFDNKTIEIKKV